MKQRIRDYINKALSRKPREFERPQDSMNTTKDVAEEERLHKAICKRVDAEIDSMGVDDLKAFVFCRRYEEEKEKVVRHDQERLRYGRPLC